MLIFTNKIAFLGQKTMEIPQGLCQSCGMPIRTKEEFGTDANGRKNKEYCHFCFKDGKFTDEGITMEQKIDKLVEIAKTKMNIPEEKAREMANRVIPKLKRWVK